MKNGSRIVLLVALIGLGGLARQSFAGSASSLTLEWQPCADSGVAGYSLYYGVTGGPLTNRIDAGTLTTTVVKGLAAATEYTFYVVAYDFDLNEGVPSDPLLYMAAPISGLTLSQINPISGNAMQIAFHVAPGAACRVEYTDTLTPPNWQLLTTATGDSNGDVTISDPIVQPSRFYRAATQSAD